ncbi:MerR family transcriptional regulator [Longimicrobium sp.]|jgi:DNA-binding transcriptional MerR regulator/methylmalonyl-CoA mutase cobalamin-binding subunit|uniref:MerR family transcriptional regulator n=1 Tax=Longimicrobium sp. TaxID=2029185 RepID=UPI002F920E5B
MTYRIKRVAHLTGINPATLRAWERRYGLVAPDRTGSGYRLYTDEDVAMLSRIKALVDEGLTIGEAITRVRRGSEPLPADGAGPSVREARARMLGALLAFDRRGALEAYDSISNLPPVRRVEEVLLPLVREVGDLWACAEIGVAEEHFASALIREKLAGIMEDLDTGTARGPEAVCVGLAGERHEFGLMGICINLATRGWRVLYLGADLPMDEVQRVVQTRRPALLCTSVVNQMGTAEFRRLVRELRDMAPPETEIVIGGPGLPDSTAVAEVAGVHVAEELVGLVHATA